MTAVPTTGLVRTRLAWHALAEWVVAPARHAVDGHIGLVATPGGFGSPTADVRVDGGALVVGDDRRPLTTLAEAAAFAGVEPGRATGVYETVNPWDPDAPLTVGEASSRLLADWFALGASALADVGATAITLWPEHFDVATTIDDRVNLGASPGDAEHADPYLYVGPWEPHEGPFWNEPFGASLGLAQVDSVDAAVAFFRSGLAQL
ncbi:MAG: hypothetical protein JWN67_1361 [Actinomycetia bacterium]|nr:hypothetical protein [Actinomycetes bacterium]